MGLYERCSGHKVIVDRTAEVGGEERKEEGEKSQMSEFERRVRGARERSRAGQAKQVARNRSN